MIRLLATPPADYNLGQLQAEGSAVAVNMVDGQIAGYWNDGTQPTQAEWEAIVAAHVPAPGPDPTAPILAELPAATLEEANDLLAQILNLIGGN
jgi:hypothetical protein